MESQKDDGAGRYRKIEIAVKLVQRTAIDDSQDISIADYLKEIRDSLQTQIMGFCTFGFADDHHNASFFRETHKI
jgi:hypothetical protein